MGKPTIVRIIRGVRISGVEIIRAILYLLQGGSSTVTETTAKRENLQSAELYLTEVSVKISLFCSIIQCSDCFKARLFVNQSHQSNCVLVIPYVMSTMVHDFWSDQFQ